MDKSVERAVDGVLTEQVVAGHVVLLPDAVGAVFALAAVGVCPGEFDECDVGGGCECESYSGGFDGADD